MTCRHIVGVTSADTVGDAVEDAVNYVIDDAVDYAVNYEAHSVWQANMQAPELA